jgi:hypothetical protein
MTLSIAMPALKTPKKRWAENGNLTNEPKVFSEIVFDLKIFK